MSGRVISATLLAAETVIFACWTRPACLTAAEARRGRKRLRQRLKAWLPEAGEDGAAAPVSARSRG